MLAILGDVRHRRVPIRERGRARLGSLSSASKSAADHSRFTPIPRTSGQHGGPAKKWQWLGAGRAATALPFCWPSFRVTGRIQYCF
jgi:hypothetical protein